MKSRTRKFALVVLVVLAMMVLNVATVFAASLGAMLFHVELPLGQVVSIVLVSSMAWTLVGAFILDGVQEDV